MCHQSQCALPYRNVYGLARRLFESSLAWAKTPQSGSERISWRSTTSMPAVRTRARCSRTSPYLGMKDKLTWVDVKSGGLLLEKRRECCHLDNLLPSAVLEEGAAQEHVSNHSHLGPETTFVTCACVISRIGHQTVDCGAIIKLKKLISTLIVRVIIGRRQPMD